ncbi:dnaJ/Hsp40 cysteine-rich domain superfamily protein [Tasmannia lanceolata]|uniref:dnaJ/Hsp40 cysteine-rich domain superfamily protein n=1 Tax=Tasmannia lanceolata TaxID=3420 RepID=UPI004063097C
MAARTAPVVAAGNFEVSPRNGKPSLRFAVSKPSWIVKTESNVWKEERKMPYPPCVICRGNGRVDCQHCQGRGRTNCVHLAMLPKGKWPKWCKTCGGSGLGYCSRCLGTGEYRDIMGFHFMKMDANPSWNCQENEAPQ